VARTADSQGCPPDTGKQVYVMPYLIGLSESEAPRGADELSETAAGFVLVHRWSARAKLNSFCCAGPTRTGHPSRSRVD